MSKKLTLIERYIIAQSMDDFENTWNDHTEFDDMEVPRLRSELTEEQLKLLNQNKDFRLVRPVKDVYITESWIVEDPKKDKSALYGMEMPKGTWMVSMKIDNDEIYELINQNKDE
jgi:hypothetical protein